MTKQLQDIQNALDKIRHITDELCDESSTERLAGILTMADAKILQVIAEARQDILIALDRQIHRDVRYHDGNETNFLDGAPILPRNAKEKRAVYRDIKAMGKAKANIEANYLLKGMKERKSA